MVQIKQERATICRIEIITNYQVIRKIIKIPTYNCRSDWEHRKNARIRFVDKQIKEILENKDLNGVYYEVEVYVMSKG